MDAIKETTGFSWLIQLAWTTCFPGTFPACFAALRPVLNTTSSHLSLILGTLPNDSTVELGHYHLFKHPVPSPVWLRRVLLVSYALTTRKGRHNVT